MPGTVRQGSFTLDGFQMCAFDAGPRFRFNPSISFYLVFETLDEVDAIWNKLIDGGEPLMPLDRYGWSERYGWVTDRYGLSWQVVPEFLTLKMLGNEVPKEEQLMEAVLRMKKLDVEALKKAYNG